MFSAFQKDCAEAQPQGPGCGWGLMSSQFGYFFKGTFCAAYSIVGGNPWIATSDMDAIVGQGVKDHVAAVDVQSSNAGRVYRRFIPKVSGNLTQIGLTYSLRNFA